MNQAQHTITKATALPDFLTKSEVATQLRRTSSGVDKLRVRDASFPKPMKDGDKRRGRVYFVRSEIEEWVRGKLDARAA